MRRSNEARNIDPGCWMEMGERSSGPAMALSSNAVSSTVRQRTAHHRSHRLAIQTQQEFDIHYAALAA
jgi:hypothetical protein